jgi:hypothetical protein
MKGKQGFQSGHKSFHTDESKAKITKKLMGREVTEETRNKIRVANTGHIKSIKNIINISLGVRRAYKEGKVMGFQEGNKSHTDLVGDKSPFWKGGQEKTRARTDRKRRGYGHKRIGFKIPGCEDHHLTKKLITSVPKKIHQRWHKGPTTKIEGVIG